MTEYKPIEVAIAVALYSFNVAPLERAQKLFDHFDGNCAELKDLVDILIDRQAFAATEFAFPTAEVYVQHALDEYGTEAVERCRVNSSSPAPTKEKI